MSEEIPKAYFLATADSEEGATAIYHLYRNRVAWQRRQAQQTGPQVDGGF